MGERGHQEAERYWLKVDDSGSILISPSPLLEYVTSALEVTRMRGTRGEGTQHHAALAARTEDVWAHPSSSSSSSKGGRFRLKKPA